MSKQKNIKLLGAAADREQLQPILEALRARGVRVREADGAVGKDDVLLAALSERFYADSDAVARLLDCVAAGAETVLPLQLDGAPMPERLKNALYSRNIIPAAGRDAAHTAARILDALPKKKSRLPLLLTAGALVLVAVLGVFVWRSAQGGGAEPEPELSVALPQGLTMEDLEKIEAVCIVGEEARFYSGAQIENMGYYIDWDEFAERRWYDDEAHWFSREDGHEYTLTRYDDLSFLGLMPNLRMLHLELIDAGTLPALSGAAKLETVTLMDSVIPDLDWLAGAAMRHSDIINSTGSITDFSPLTSCEKLREVHIDLVNTRQAELGGFAPPKLDWLWISNGDDLQGELDLSALSSCSRLRECQLDYNDKITDLGFLPKDAPLEHLRLNNLRRLRDISALSGRKGLTDLNISGCDALRDYSPIGGCADLERLSLYVDWNAPLRDGSFLSGLAHLKELELYGVALPDLDFLSAAARTQAMSQSKLQRLELSGTVGDCSALSMFEKYENLVLDLSDGRSAQFLPYLQDAAISNLTLRNVYDLDLSALPWVTGRLELDRCGVTDLSAFPEGYEVLRLNLNKCAQLRSLSGLERLSKLGKGYGDLEIYSCQRLADFSALEGMKLSTLSITGGYVLPELEQLSLGVLRLDSVAGVTDLSFVDCLDDTRSCSFELIGLDELNDLSPLRRMHGSYLAVPPQLEAQAEELVEAKYFQSYRIEYPEDWVQEDLDFTLLSLDELQTLPKSMLRHVTSLGIAGDQLVDLDHYDIWEDWDHRDANGNPTLQLHDRETDAVTPLAPGVITDLSRLSALTGLRELYLVGQPLKNLDGIQVFSSLEEFSAKGCAALSDASALFALPELRWVDLKCTQVESIQGVQNLRELRSLDVSNTRVSDLTPLADCDLSVAFEDLGFDLNINELELSEEDFAAIGSIRRFQGLAFTDADPAIWIPALADCEIRFFGAAGDLRGNEDLAAFVADHPELEILWLGWAGEITDLTCLVPLENLERVSVNRDMTAAIASLDGLSYGFELEIND